MPRPHPASGGGCRPRGITSSRWRIAKDTPAKEAVDACLKNIMVAGCFGNAPKGIDGIKSSKTIPQQGVGAGDA